MRSPSPDAPANLRNGLKWREGRPRWEPSPKNREAGIRGLDLKRADGSWMNRGEAIAAADARHLWAAIVREARQDGPRAVEARQNIRDALAGLPAALTAQERHERALLADLVELARATVEAREEQSVRAGAFAPLTVAAMRAGYFRDVERGVVELAASSVENYTSMSKRLVAKFGERRVDELHRGDMRNWYVELKGELSLSTANQTLKIAGALFKWATLQSPPWCENNPCSELGMTTAPGRLVFWERFETDPFEIWCDANGYVDVADAQTLGVWTGARPSDMCRANLPDLAGDTWRFKPKKTERRSTLEANPGLIQAVKDRVERRKAAAEAATVRPLGPVPFLAHPQSGARHTVRSLRGRFNEALAAAILSESVPASAQDKHVQDWRDSCLTLLWEGIGLERIPTWTGHSPKDVATILRAHYVVVRDAYARESARKLEAYIAANI